MAEAGGRGTDAGTWRAWLRRRVRCAVLCSARCVGSVLGKAPRWRVAAMGRQRDRGSAAEARLRARRELAEARAKEDPAVRQPPSPCARGRGVRGGASGRAGGCETPRSAWAAPAGAPTGRHGGRAPRTAGVGQGCWVTCGQPGQPGRLRRCDACVRWGLASRGTLGTARRSRISPASVPAQHALEEQTRSSADRPDAAAVARARRTDPNEISAPEHRELTPVCSLLRVSQNAFWREIDCPMGGGQPARGDAPLRPMTTFAEREHRDHIIVRARNRSAPSVATVSSAPRQQSDAQAARSPR